MSLTACAPFLMNAHIKALLSSPIKDLCDRLPAPPSVLRFILRRYCDSSAIACVRDRVRRLRARRYPRHTPGLSEIETPGCIAVRPSRMHSARLFLAAGGACIAQEVEALPDGAV